MTETLKNKRGRFFSETQCTLHHINAADTHMNIQQCYYSCTWYIHTNLRLITASVSLSVWLLACLAMKQMVVQLFSIGNESVPIQLAQCSFPALAISTAKHKYTYQIKYTRKQLYRTARGNCFVWIEITKIHNAVFFKFIVSFIRIFGTLSFPIEI